MVSETKTKLAIQRIKKQVWAHEKEKNPYVFIVFSYKKF